MILVLLFILFTVVGFADTIYLISKRKKGEAPICPLKGDCAFVLQSKYNKIFGVHTDMIGLAYFAGVILWMVSLTAFGFLASQGVITFENGIAPYVLPGYMYAILLATTLAFLMTLRMLFLEFFVIKKMCFWCLLSSICVIGMTVCLALMVFVGSTI